MAAVGAALVYSFVLGSVALGCFNPNIRSGGFACDGSDPSDCPSGFDCVGGKCVVSSNIAGGKAPLTVMKTSMYTGLQLDPQLSSTSDCPDEDLEPNDGLGAAPFGPPIAINAILDGDTPKIQRMAICPTGINPATGRHDVDWFQVVTDAPSTMLAQATYDVAYGDLDLAIADSGGNIIAADGTSVSNACVAMLLQPGTYYVVVVGAENTASNRYDLRVRTYSQSASCDQADMGPAHD